MAYAGRAEDMKFEDRYSSSRLRPLILQAVKEPWLREAFLGLLYRIEELERKVEKLEAPKP